MKLARPWLHFDRYSIRTNNSDGNRLVTLSFKTKSGLTTWWWSPMYSEFPDLGNVKNGPFHNKRAAILSVDSFLQERGYTLIHDKLRGML